MFRSYRVAPVNRRQYCSLLEHRLSGDIASQRESLWNDDIKVDWGDRMALRARGDFRK